MNGSGEYPLVVFMEDLYVRRARMRRRLPAGDVVEVLTMSGALMGRLFWVVRNRGGDGAEA